MDEEKGSVQLIEQVKNGDERAFAEFYSQTYKYVYSRAKCMFSDEQEVQDLVQEVYLALYRNAANIQSGESIFGWLKTTTFYQGTKMLKKKRKEVLLSEEGEGMFESIPDDEPEIEEGYMNEEDVQVIRECINRLSDEQKTVLLAYYYDNLKVNEIAEILSLSAGTIKSRLYLARKNLQVHIEEEEKKRGYKLHSFGAVTLALALRMFLQGNMEVAGSVEETIFAKVCQGLNFEVSKTVAAQSGIAEQVAQEGTKQAGKGILGKLGALGAKKVAISAVGIIAAVAIGITAVVNSKQDNEENESSQVSEYAQNLKELQQWQIDYARILLALTCMPGEVQNISMPDSLLQEDLDIFLKELQKQARPEEAEPSDTFMFFGLKDSDLDGEPELYVEFRDGEETYKNTYMFTRGKHIEECYIGQVDSDDSMKMYSIYDGGYSTVLEVLGVDISQEDKLLLTNMDYVFYHYLANSSDTIENYSGWKYTTIWFDQNDEPDDVFIKDDFLMVLMDNDDSYLDYVDSATERVAFIEKEGKILNHHKTDESEDLIVRIAVDEYSWKVQHGIHKMFLTDSSGTTGVRYYYTDYEYDSTDGLYPNRDISEDEYMKMYSEYSEGEIDFYTGLEYVDVLEQLYGMEFTLAK